MSLTLSGESRSVVMVGSSLLRRSWLALGSEALDPGDLVVGWVVYSEVVRCASRADPSFRLCEWGIGGRPCAGEGCGYERWWSCQLWAGAERPGSCDFRECSR
jgi:hypothetical protein